MEAQIKSKGVGSESSGANGSSSGSSSGGRQTIAHTSGGTIAFQQVVSFDSASDGSDDDDTVDDDTDDELASKPSAPASAPLPFPSTRVPVPVPVTVPAAAAAADADADSAFSGMTDDDIPRPVAAPAAGSKRRRLLRGAESSRNAGSSSSSSEGEGEADADPRVSKAVRSLFRSTRGSDGPLTLRVSKAVASDPIRSAIRRAAGRADPSPIAFPDCDIDSISEADDEGHMAPRDPVRRPHVRGSAAPVRTQGSKPNAAPLSTAATAATAQTASDQKRPALIRKPVSAPARADSAAADAVFPRVERGPSGPSAVLEGRLSRTASPPEDVTVRRTEVVMHSPVSVQRSVVALWKATPQAFSEARIRIDVPGHASRYQTALPDMLTLDERSHDSKCRHGLRPESSAAHAAVSDAFLESVHELSRAVDLHVGCRVGAPHPTVRSPVADRPAVLPAVLVTWRPAVDPSDFELLSAMAQPSNDSESGQSGVDALAAGFAYVAFRNHPTLVAVPICDLKLRNHAKTRTVTDEEALSILADADGAVPVALRRVKALILQRQTARNNDGRAKVVNDDRGRAIASAGVSNAADAGGARACATQRVDSSSSRRLQIYLSGMSFQRAIEALSWYAETADLPRCTLACVRVAPCHASERRHWNAVEQRNFTVAMNRFGRDFRAISQFLSSVAPAGGAKKTRSECVDFYYRLKHWRMLACGLGHRSRSLTTVLIPCPDTPTPIPTSLSNALASPCTPLYPAAACSEGVAMHWAPQACSPIEPTFAPLRPGFCTACSAPRKDVMPCHMRKCGSVLCVKCYETALRKSLIRTLNKAHPARGVKNPWFACLKCCPPQITRGGADAASRNVAPRGTAETAHQSISQISDTTADGESASRLVSDRASKQVSSFSSASACASVPVAASVAAPVPALASAPVLPKSTLSHLQPQTMEEITENVDKATIALWHLVLPFPEVKMVVVEAFKRLLHGALLSGEDSYSVQNALEITAYAIANHRLLRSSSQLSFIANLLPEPLRSAFLNSLRTRMLYKT
jgi:hypothetical protein